MSGGFSTVEVIVGHLANPPDAQLSLRDAAGAEAVSEVVSGEPAPDGAWHFADAA